MEEDIQKRLLQLTEDVIKRLNILGKHGWHFFSLNGNLCMSMSYEDKRTYYIIFHYSKSEDKIFTTLMSNVSADLGSVDEMCENSRKMIELCNANRVLSTEVDMQKWLLDYFKKKDYLLELQTNPISIDGYMTKGMFSSMMPECTLDGFYAQHNDKISTILSETFQKAFNFNLKNNDAPVKCRITIQRL